MPKPIDYNAILVEREEVRPGLAIMRFRPKGWTPKPLKAGQYAMIGLPGSAPRHPLAVAEEKPLAADKLAKRAYSVTHAEGSEDLIELYVVMVPHGQLSSRLLALDVGDACWMATRYLGDFLFEAPTPSKVVWIGTGTGTAPFMSMMRTHSHAGDGRHYLLFHGVRTSDELGYANELKTRDAAQDNFSYYPCIDQPQDDPEWSGPKGWVQDHWRSGAFHEALGGAPSPADTHVYLCGNPLMVDAMTELLQSEGYTLDSKKNPGQIHIESYW